MPWDIQDTMSLREEFVCLAGQEGANRRELCRRFGISPQTAYKWLARYANEGKAGLLDRSRRPQSSPIQTPAGVQAAVVDLRREHPAWGGRKISRRLQDLGQVTVAPSTVSSILHRHGLIAPQTAEDKAWQRFEEVSLVLAGLATPLVFSVHSVVSMDFATSLVPGWHSTIFPPYFVAGAIFSGFAMVQTLLLVIRKAMKLEAYITRKHVEYMNIVIMVTGGIVAVAYGTEFFMSWYSGVEYEAYTYMSVGAATGQYAWAFWALIICNILIPSMLWFKAVRTSFFWAWAISIVINVGMWFERFDIIVLCLHHDYLPSSWTMFYPTWVDVGTFLGTIGIFFTLYLLFARFFPVLAFNELKTILKGSGESYKGDVLPKSQH